MFVTELALIDFRNYTEASLTLSSGVTVFVGSNGQGKTNLVEAIEYLSTMSSHRVAATAPLIRAGRGDGSGAGQGAGRPRGSAGDLAGAGDRQRPLQRGAPQPGAVGTPA